MTKEDKVPELCK